MSVEQSIETAKVGERLDSSAFTHRNDTKGMLSSRRVESIQKSERADGFEGDTGLNSLIKHI